MMERKDERGLLPFAINAAPVSQERKKQLTTMPNSGASRRPPTHIWIQRHIVQRLSD